MKMRVMNQAKNPCVNLKKSVIDASSKNANNPVIFANRQEIIPNPKHQNAVCSNSSLQVSLYRISKNNPDDSSAIGKCMKSG